MTRANIVRNIINDDGYYYTKHSVLEIVNVIFDEHEAQLKAKDDEIERLKAEVENLNTEIEYYEQFSETIASAKG